jgi:hypothetical protein
MKRSISVLVTLTLLVLALTAALPAQAKDKVTICHKPGTPAQKTMRVPEQAVQGHEGHGDTRGACATSSPPADAPSDDDGVKVEICHKPGTPAEKTLWVSAEDLQSHLDHGDSEDACDPTAPPSDDAKKVMVCHKPGTPAEKTLHVAIQALAGHLVHGDTVGTCEDQTLAPLSAESESVSCVWVRVFAMAHGLRHRPPC